MFTSLGSIAFLLLFLSMIHIEQNIIMDACNEFHFLHKLSYNHFHIFTIVNLNSQGLQVVICPQTWCSTREDHEQREFRTRLGPTSIPKQNLSQMFIPTIHVGRGSSKHSYAMLDGLDHALNHSIALKSLGWSALVLNSVIPTHYIELCNPLPPIINQYKSGNSVPANHFILQKLSCCLRPMISNCFSFAPLRVVVDSHQDIFVA